MRKGLKKLSAFFIILLTFPFFLLANLVKGNHKKEEKKEEPDTIQNQYSDPFRGRNIIVKSINTTASAVTGFLDDIFPE